MILPLRVRPFQPKQVESTNYVYQGHIKGDRKFIFLALKHTGQWAENIAISWKALKCSVQAELQVVEEETYCCPPGGDRAVTWPPHKGETEMMPWKRQLHQLSTGKHKLFRRTAVPGDMLPIKKLWSLLHRARHLKETWEMLDITLDPKRLATPFPLWFFRASCNYSLWLLEAMWSRDYVLPCPEKTRQLKTDLSLKPITH